MKCTTCDSDLVDNALFCTNCGAQTPTGMRQSSAGKQTTSLSSPPASSGQSPWSPPSFTLPASSTSYSSQTIYTQVQANNSMAIISLVFGILAWTFLPVIGTGVAIITGHIARREIRDSNGLYSGQGMATVGLILGYLQLILLVIGCAAFAMLFMLGVGLSL